MTQLVWNGEKNRPFSLNRSCSCGRDGYKGVGYLTGSNAEGDGFTIWIKDEKIFHSIAKILPSQEAHRWQG